MIPSNRTALTRRTLIRGTVGAGALLGVGAFMGARAAEADSPQFVDVVSCVLRGDPKTLAWSILDDAGHRPFGVKEVLVLRDRVRLVYTAPLLQYGHLHASPDETYARLGVSVGASGALAFADLMFGRNGVPLTPAQACIKGSNLWFSGQGWVTSEDAERLALARGSVPSR